MKKIVAFILLICSAWILQATEYVYIMSDYGKPSFTTADGRFQTLGKKSDGVTGPSYNGAENSLDVRLYAKNTYTITSLTGVKMKHIAFIISRKGKYNLTSLTPTNGTCEVVGAPDYTATWTGDATEVTFTIGDRAIYGIEGESEAGQLDFTQLVITVDDSSPVKNTDNKLVEIIAANGVLTVNGINDGTQVELFNLTGSRILSQPLSNSQIITGNLHCGIYIVKINNKTTKVFIQ
ncbi:MAG TPA: T9SS type A sorting domain-containing protein [Paludibacteraceae bacterium]|nr:T9SS type A sorting domain-containing protein [Paludibacteraceae bacterium]HQB68585.1 T9SS type A sorting domain-containing protein [Paludibacteraceae bacterium]